jgi:hypothetical protein
MNDYDKKWCVDLFNEVIKWPISRPFLRPVDPVNDGAPTYFQVIKKPMDFSAIASKLRQDQYGSPDSFIQDIKLVSDNATQFNGEQSILSNFAKDIFGLVQRRFSEKPENATQQWYNELVRTSASMGRLIRDPPPAVARGVRRQSQT